MWLLSNLKTSFKVCSPSVEASALSRDLLKLSLTSLTSLTSDEKFAPRESSLFSSISASLYAFSRASSLVSLLLMSMRGFPEDDDFSMEDSNLSDCFS